MYWNFLFFVLLLVILYFIKYDKTITGGGMVRYAKEEDAVDIKRLADKYIFDVYSTELKTNKDAVLESHTLDEVKELALDKISPTFVYEDDGKVVGFISLYQKNPQLYAIKLFSVDETEQSKGIGTILMNRALSEFKTDYYLKVNFYNPLKDKLIKYYSKFGFEVCEENKEYIKMFKKYNSMETLMNELQLEKIKDLESGFCGNVAIVKNNIGELLFLKVERLDSTPSNSKTIPDYESEYYRQIDFNEQVAKYNTDKFMVLEKHGILKNCDFIKDKLKQRMLDLDFNTKNSSRKDSQPHCYYLLYKTVLDGTFKDVSNKIKKNKKLLLDFIIQVISAINIYRKLGFIHADITTRNIMFKKINCVYKWYIIDYGNITNSKYPDSYLDISISEYLRNYKESLHSDLDRFIFTICIESNINDLKVNNLKSEEFMAYIKHTNIKVYEEIISYFPSKDLQNISKNKSYKLFGIVFKILYPTEFAKYFKFKYNKRKHLLKYVLVTCIKHSRDKTYDELLSLISTMT